MKKKTKQTERERERDKGVRGGGRGGEKPECYLFSKIVLYRLQISIECASDFLSFPEWNKSK